MMNKKSLVTGIVLFLISGTSAVVCAESHDATSVFFGFFGIVTFIMAVVKTILGTFHNELTT
jgi:hypothetical protein